MAVLPLIVKAGKVVLSTAAARKVAGGLIALGIAKEAAPELARKIVDIADKPTPRGARSAAKRFFAGTPFGKALHAIDIIQAAIEHPPKAGVELSMDEIRNLIDLGSKK